MKKRSKESQFYTFINLSEFEGHLVVTWATEPELFRNMQALFSTTPEAKELYFVNLFLKKIKNEKENSEIAKRHICAYLEEVCYWLGMKTASKASQYNYTALDCFQIARTIVADSETLFERYNETRSNLKTYIQLKVKTQLLETIYIDKEVQKYSPTGLLRNVSQKYLKNALTRAGLDHHTAQIHLRAWESFKENYHPQKPKGSQTLSWPNPADLELIVAQHNKKNTNETIDIETLETLLKNCVQHIMFYVKPNYVPLEDNFQEVSNYHETDSLWITEQDTDEPQQIISLVADFLKNLDNNQQIIVILFYGLEMTQTSIAKVFSDNRIEQYDKQYKISRFCDRLKQNILEEISLALKINTNLQEIKEKADHLDDWLKLHYQNQCHKILKIHLLQEYFIDLPLLKKYFVSLSQADSKSSSVQAKLEETRQVIQKIKEIEKDLGNKLLETIQREIVDLSPINSQKSLQKLVRTWLADAPYAALEAESPPSKKP